MLYVLRCVESNEFFIGMYDAARQPMFNPDQCYLCDTLDEAKHLKACLAELGYYVGIESVEIKPT